MEHCNERARLLRGNTIANFRRQLDPHKLRGDYTQPLPGHQVPTARDCHVTRDETWTPQSDDDAGAGSDPQGSCVPSGSNTTPDTISEQDMYVYVSSIPIQGRTVDSDGNIRRIDINKIWPWEYMYIDVLTLPKNQFQGYDYAMVLVEMKSNMIDVRLMKKKNHAGEVIQNILVSRNVPKLPYHTTIHCDGDGANLGIAAAVIDLGVGVVIIEPYSPNLNTAELAIRVIKKDAFRLALHAKMDPIYVGLAMVHAAHHHQFISSSAIRKGRTPWEMVYGVQPDISKLRAFGSLAYAVLSSPKRQAAKTNRTGASAITTTQPVILMGYQQSMSNRSYKFMTLQGETMHTSQATFVADDPRDQQGVHGCQRTFGQFHTGAYDNFEQMISVYNNKAHLAMTDKELLQRMRIMPEFGMEAEHINDTLQQTMLRFNQSRSELLEYAMHYDEEQHSDNAEPVFEDYPVPKKTIDPPSKAGQDKPVTLMPRRTRAQNALSTATAETIGPAVTSIEGKQPILPQYVPDDNWQPQKNPAIYAHNSCIDDGQEGSVRYSELYMIAQRKARTITDNKKDINWKRALHEHSPIRDVSIAAYHKEFKSLTETHGILEVLKPGHPDYDEAVRDACLARALLGLKRSDPTTNIELAKARIVLRGDLQKNDSDPEGFSYYANVASWPSIRTAISFFNSTDDVIATFPAKSQV